MIDLLDIIGCLFNNGADPTVKCKVGKTPRDVATRNRFKLGATLLGKLELLNCMVLLMLHITKQKFWSISGQRVMSGVLTIKMKRYVYINSSFSGKLVTWVCVN